MFTRVTKDTKTFLDLVKVEDQIANSLAFLTGYAFSTHFTILGPPLVFAVTSCCLGLMAANAFNQCCDVEIDRVNRPNRPLPSSRVSLRSAHVIVTFLYLASVASAVLVNMEFLALASVGLIISILYSVKPFRIKDRFITCNISIALGYGAINFLLGWCVYEPILLAPLPIIAFLALFDFFANMSKDYRDVKGDVAFNSRTLPTVLGRDSAIKFQLTALYLTFTLPIALFFFGFVDTFSLLTTPIGIALCASSHKHLLNRKDVECYKDMMLLYILLRLVLTSSVIL